MASRYGVFSVVAPAHPCARDISESFQFYTVIYCPQPASLRQAVRDGVRYRDWIFDAANVVAEKLGSYSAIHARRNDFNRAYSEQVPEVDQILRNIDPVLKPNEDLYVATDESDHAVFDALAQRYRLWFAGDVEELLPTEGKSVEFLPLIEQVVCAHGRVFIGTRLSTMSSYIYRLRGHLGASDTNYYVVSEMNSPEPQSYNTPSWRGLVGVGDQWTREFPEAWDYSAPGWHMPVPLWATRVKQGLRRLVRAFAVSDSPVVIESSSRLRHHSRWRMEARGERFVLRAPPGKKDFRCDATTALIWELCDGDRSVERIAETLVEAYPDGAARIPGDVRRVVGKLSSRGALVQTRSLDDVCGELLEASRHLIPVDHREWREELCVVSVATRGDRDRFGHHRLFETSLDVLERSLKRTGHKDQAVPR